MNSFIKNISKIFKKNINQHKIIQESKTTLSGFTPLIDSVTDEFGLTTSAVYSVIWRHEQMNQKVCKCSVGTIAKLLNISYKTVHRRLNILKENNLIIDVTPKNVDIKKPRWYKTKRIKVEHEVKELHSDWRTTYEKYLCSTHWKNVKIRFKRRKCFVCANTKNLHLHHRNYDCLSKETEKDLVTLCDNHHKQVHELAKNKSNELTINTAVEYLKGAK